MKAGGGAAQPSWPVGVVVRAGIQFQICVTELCTFSYSGYYQGIREV